MKAYIAKYDNFTVRISSHALERLVERIGEVPKARLRAAGEMIARRCKRFHAKSHDVVQMEVLGAVWTVLIHSNKRATVKTVIPTGWKNNDYSMSEWL